MHRKGNGTKFIIDRKIFSSDIWWASPWKLKIWIYLLGQANYKENEYMGIRLKRGQLIRSYRTVQKDCAYKIGYRLKKPSLHTIRRIYEELTKDGRITIRKTRQGSLVTIIKYDDFQRFDLRRAQRKDYEGHKGGTVGEQDNKECINDIYICWNEEKIILHKSAEPFENAIKIALKKYPKEEIINAIKNYGFILRGKDYFWYSYRFTLNKFLTITAKTNHIEEFLDLEIAKNNYKKDRSKEDTEEQISEPPALD